MLNRRTFLSYSGGAISLPIVTKLDWLMNEHTGHLVGDCQPVFGTPPSDVTTLLLRARCLISDPSRWCQGTHWMEGRFCITGALVAERLRCEIITHRPDINRNDIEFLKEFQRDLDGYAWKDNDHDYAPVRDDLVHSARWVLNVIVRCEKGHRGHVENWNDFPSTTHADVLDVLNRAMVYELSDTYAAEVILRTNPDVCGLFEDPAIDFSPSSVEPGSVIEKTYNRVIDLTPSRHPEAWRSI